MKNWKRNPYKSYGTLYQLNMEKLSKACGEKLIKPFMYNNSSYKPCSDENSESSSFSYFSTN